MLTLVQTRTDAHFDQVLSLMLQYRDDIVSLTDEMGVCACFDMVEENLDDIRLEFAPPRGRFYLALWMTDEGAGRVAGCGGIRPIDDTSCELKRVFVAPAMRRHGVGRGLVARLVQDAGKAGYATMRLEALPTMRHALGIFREAGFVEGPPWREVPAEWGAWVNLEKRL